MKKATFWVVARPFPFRLPEAVALPSKFLEGQRGCRNSPPRSHRAKDVNRLRLQLR
jgi:hypothetical protein